MSDDERRSAAFLLGIISYLEKALKVEKTDAQTRLALRAGERLAIETPDGVTVGYIGMTQGRKSIHVYDWDKLAAWLKKHVPGSVKTTVDPVWWEAHKASIIKLGSLIDDSGEVCDEVTVVQGDPFVSVKLDEKAGALELLGSLFKSKRIMFDPTQAKAITAKAAPKRGSTK